MLFICHPNCTTCRKAGAFLDARGVAYEVRDIRAENPTPAELRAWQAAGGLPLRRFFNTSGKLYREPGLARRLPDIPEEEQLRLLSSDGMLVKRPLLVAEDFVLVGFCRTEWEEKL